MGAGDILQGVIEGLIYPPTPFSPSGQDIASWASQNKPGSSVTGTLVKDSGVPYCVLWLF